MVNTLLTNPPTVEDRCYSLLWSTMRCGDLARLVSLLGPAWTASLLPAQVDEQIDRQTVVAVADVDRSRAM
jgi:hypothetical protein